MWWTMCERVWGKPLFWFVVILLALVANAAAWADPWAEQCTRLGSSHVCANDYGVTVYQADGSYTRTWGNVTWEVYPNGLVRVYRNGQLLGERWRYKAGPRLRCVPVGAGVLPMPGPSAGGCDKG